MAQKFHTQFLEIGLQIAETGTGTTPATENKGIPLQPLHLILSLLLGLFATKATVLLVPNT